MLALAVSSSVAAKTLVYCSEGSPENFNPQLYTSGTSVDASAVPVYNRLVDFKASPTYLARYGTPHTIEGLTGHVMIGFVSSRTQRTLPLSFTQDGRQSEVSLPCRLLTSDADVGAEAARLGFGLYQAPLPRLEADLASGALTEVLADFRPAPLPLSLLYPSNRQLSARVQVFIDWVTALMKPPLAQQASGRLK